MGSKGISQLLHQKVPSLFLNTSSSHPVHLATITLHSLHLDTMAPTSTSFQPHIHLKYFRLHLHVTLFFCVVVVAILQHSRKTSSNTSCLASSSSYTISLIKACSIFLNHNISDSQICKLAHQLELKYNPYCGYQDPYGCGIGGFKRMEFYKDSRIKYEFLPNDLFDRYDMFLLYTGVTRNSRKILADITQNLDKVKPLLDIVEEAYTDVYTKDPINLLYHLKNAWDAKKKVSSIIDENPEVKKLDDELSHNQHVLAHKLCGAGNGGFFLTFAQKNELTLPKNAVKIKVVTEGVLGESI